MDRINLSLICLALTLATICSAADPKFPNIKELIENGFMSEVEISGRPENSTAFVKEFYNVDDRVTKIEILNQGHRQTIIVHGKMNQVASIEDNACSVTSGGKAESLLNPLFQKWLYSAEGDNEVYYGPTSILRRAHDSPPAYSGITTVRGIDCHTFTDGDPDNDNSAIKYFFTADWTTPTNIPKSVLLPVQIQLFGQGIPVKDAPIENYVQYVDYIFFNPSVKDPTAFELPTGVGCKDLKSDKEPPAAPKRFTVTGEEFNAKSEIMSVNTFRAWYDYPSKLARLDMYTKNDRGISKVLDYNTGLMYVTRDNEECVASPISDSFFDETTGNLKLVMKDPESAMLFTGDSYYLGKKFSRGIYCDVWESVVENAKLDDLVLNRLVYTYYFSSSWWEVDVEGEIEEQVPIRLEINTYTEATGDPDVQTVLNFFGFRQHPPRVYTQFSIENCEIGTSEKKYVGIIIETDTDSIKKAEAQASNFRDLVFENIYKIAGISPIRVPVVRVDYEPGSITILALILERGPATAQFQMIDDDAPKSKEVDKGIVKTEELCAEECIGEEGCTGFHYCRDKGQCFVSFIDWTEDSGDDLKGFTSCKVYRRHVAGNQIKDVLLKDALKNLDDAISGKKFMLVIRDKNDEVEFVATDFSPDISPVTTGDHDKDMFTRVIGQKKFKDSRMSQTTRDGHEVLSAGDCYRMCKKEENIACSSFSFCIDTNKCLLSSVLVLASKNLDEELESDPMCSVYSINYLEMFDEYQGQVLMSPGKEAINADSPTECAKSCREKEKPICRGFDYCTSKKQCVLHEIHVLDIKENDLTSVGSGCSHYALKFSADYTEFGRFVIVDPDSKDVMGVSMEKCAQLCSENIEYKCPAFDFCESSEPKNRKCVLNTITVEDATKTNDVDDCQHYEKKDVVDDFTNLKRAKTPDPSETSGYTPGGLAGVIIGVLIAGIAVGIMGFLIYSYLRKSRLTDDRTVRFMKQDNE